MCLVCSFDLWYVYLWMDVKALEDRCGIRANFTHVNFYVKIKSK